MTERMLWKEKEISRVRAVQMDLRGLLGIRSINRVPNAQIRELCRVKKGQDEGLINVFSGGSAMWRGWKGIGLPRESM